MTLQVIFSIPVTPILKYGRDTQRNHPQVGLKGFAEIQEGDGLL